jgi:uncharacterized protein YndB with AHSA1/START domain
MSMSMIDVEPGIQTITITREIEIAAPIEIAFEAMLEEMGPGGEMPGGKPFPMVIEQWPGGRWYRDLGDNAGHLWGHVQVIKPPTLLEIVGPMFMSYPAVGWVQYRVIENAGVCNLTLTHRVFGEMEPQHREGVQKGWGMMLDRIKARATK